MDAAGRFAGLPPGVVWVPHATGGFSGARVWRGTVAGVPLFALKRWPTAMTADRLRRIHEWIKQAANLPFVPRLFPTPNNWTAIVHDGAAWDLSEWMAGEPIPSSKIDEATVRAAVNAVLDLHRAWKPRRPELAPCPAVERRLRLLNEWEADPPRHPADDLAFTACRIVTEALPDARRELQPWLARPMPVQPCLCDGHREHFLFAAGRLAGVIDYGAMKIDHVAADAARTLGDMGGDNERLFALGLDLFARAHGETSCPRDLVRLLDRTGTLGAIAYWARRGVRTLGETERLARLVARWEGRGYNGPAAPEPPA